MIRDLTSEEVRLVDSKSKPDGSRPMVYDPSVGGYYEIGRDIEVFLILAPLSWKNEASNFLRALSDNDLSNRDVLNDLRGLWLNDEYADVGVDIEGYSDIFDSYDSVKSGLDGSLPGFESVDGLNSLARTINSGLAGLVEARDSSNFSKAALATMRIRLGSRSGRDDVRLELLSWAQALISYS